MEKFSNWRVRSTEPSLSHSSPQVSTVDHSFMIDLVKAYFDRVCPPNTSLIGHSSLQRHSFWSIGSLYRTRPIRLPASAPVESQVPRPDRSDFLSIGCSEDINFGGLGMHLCTSQPIMGFYVCKSFIYTLLAYTESPFMGTKEINLGFSYDFPRFGLITLFF